MDKTIEEGRRRKEEWEGPLLCNFDGCCLRIDKKAEKGVNMQETGIEVKLEDRCESKFVGKASSVWKTSLLSSLVTGNN